MANEEPKKELIENDYDVEITSDDLDRLFTSEDEVETPSTSALADVDENSEETATTETETQETEQPSEDESVSTENPYVFKHGEREYSAEELTLAIEALSNKEDWQKSNTQKAQEVAEDRKKLDSIMSVVNKAVESDELKDVLGEDHELFKSIKDFEGLPEQEQETIESPEQEKMQLLEDKIFRLEAEKQVNEDIAELMLRHPELRDSREALNDVLEVAVTKNLGLEDAYVFAMASSDGKSKLKEAIKSVEEAEKLKAQPEVKPSGKGKVEEPVPLGKDFDEIAEIALDRYNLFKTG
tara:strand:+ start:537 stop:1427 length:891 start_codon:yes stop_codon:yes gene_type:complete